MNDNDKEPRMLRLEEASELQNSVKDLVTSQLLSMASTCVMRKFMENTTLPISDFDMRFFSEAMLDFCSKHENLKKILAGEDLRWFDDEDMGSPNGRLAVMLLTGRRVGNRRKDLTAFSERGG